MSSATQQPPGHLVHLTELFDARVALAKLEVRHDIACSRRLGIVAGIGGVVVVIGLTLLTFVLAESIANLTKTDPLWWRLGFGVGMTLAGAAAIYLGWRTFRREFSGLAETLDELREDRAWVTELAAEALHSAGLRAPESEPGEDS